jgi:hypothetical protein
MCLASSPFQPSAFESALHECIGWTQTGAVIVTGWLSTVFGLADEVGTSAVCHMHMVIKVFCCWCVHGRFPALAPVFVMGL